MTNGIAAAPEAPFMAEKKNLGSWWVAAGFAVILAVGLAVLVASKTKFDAGHRASVALVSLLVIIALWLFFQAVLLTFQTRVPKPSSDFQPRAGMQAAFIGQDNRASTSKTQVTLWTAALVWALVDLLLLARSYPRGGLFTDALTTNWHPDYLVLLGLPAAAATVAKVAVTSANSNKGPLTKAAAGASPAKPVYVRDPKAEKENRQWLVGFVDRIAELLTGDDGSLDWTDLQYVVFTLVTLVYFVLQLLSQPRAGLPAIPPALLTLMGVSTSAYAANKIASTKGQVTPS
jgi:hypothetical protein